MPYMMISLGGVTVGVAVILVVLIRWWFAEGHRWTALVTFVLSLLYGMVAALAALGSWSALGLVTWVSLWTANVSGYLALVWGVGGTDHNITRAPQLALTSGGYAIVLLLTAILIALWKFAAKIPNWKIAWGVFAGVAMALSGNVAGVAAVPLASSVNLAGSWFTAVFG